MGDVKRDYRGPRVADDRDAGEETCTVRSLAGAEEVPRTVTVAAAGPGGTREFAATVRIGTPAEATYYRHGGILPYVLRHLVNR